MRVLQDSIPGSQTSQEQDQSMGICIQDYMQAYVFGLSFFLSSIEVCPALNLDSFGTYKWMSPSNINLFTLVTAFLGHVVCAKTKTVWMQGELDKFFSGCQWECAYSYCMLAQILHQSWSKRWLSAWRIGSRRLLWVCISAGRVHLTPGSPFLLVDMANISMNAHCRFHPIPLPSPGTALYGSTLECSVRSSGTSAILSNP